MSHDECKDCALGHASGEGRGQFCPFIRRHYQRGDVLYREGERADYVWFVKSGAVELQSREHGRGVETLTEGSFVGLESLIDDPYQATAEVADHTTLCGATRQGMADWLGPSADRTCVLLRDLLRRSRPGEPSE